MQIAIQTRFSFFGKGDWQSDASRDADLLFSTERMERRFFLYENLTLPSLRAQTDADFIYYVLSSQKMPPRYKKRLRELLFSELGEKRVRLNFGRPVAAGRLLRKFLLRDFAPDEYVAQAVLDDDDALSSQFVERLRMVARHQQNHFDETQNCELISFPTGYSLDIASPDQKLFFPNYDPLIYLGLSWLARADHGKNAFLIKRNQIGGRYPNAGAFLEQPLYIRSIHSDSDSQAVIQNRERLRFVETDNLAQGFDYLTVENIEKLRSGYRQMNAA